MDVVKCCLFHHVVLCLFLYHYCKLYIYIYVYIMISNVRHMFLEISIACEACFFWHNLELAAF